MYVNSLFFRRCGNVSKGRDLVKNCVSTFLLVVKPVEGGSHIGGKWLPQFDDLPAPTSTTSILTELNFCPRQTETAKARKPHEHTCKHVFPNTRAPLS